MITLHESHPHKRYIKQAADALENGGIIIFPTDTHYGIGCDLFNIKAVKRLYQITNCDYHKLFSCVHYDFSMISKYANISTEVYRLMKHYLPGPFTFILKGTSALPKQTLTKRKTIGIRMPENNVLRAICEIFSKPILTASVRFKSDQALDVPSEIEKHYNDKVDLIFETGNSTHEHTTILDLSNDEEWAINREGKGLLDNNHLTLLN